jgi:hypothetical protein
MGSKGSRDQEGSTAGLHSGPISADVNRPHATAIRLRRARAAAWIAGVSLVFLFTGLLFTRQAVGHWRVQEDLGAAAVALAAARAAHAREYAPDNWLLATSRMDKAMAELHRQDGRFVLIRSYPSVHELLVRAIDAAEVAKTIAETAQTAVPGSWGQMIPAPSNDETRRAIAAALASVDTLSGLLGRIEGCPGARRARDIRNDLEVVKRNLVAYRNQCDELQGRFARGEMAPAKRQADTLKGLASPYCKDLENILWKFKCK